MSTQMAAKSVATAEKSDQNGLKSGVEVKFVTIAGKQVEITYETRRRRVDIFGLHSRDRERKSTNNHYLSKMFKSNKSNDRNLMNGKQSKDTIKTNDLPKESISNGVNDKTLQRLESSEKFAKKSDLSVEKIANRIKKEKEPVKTGNRFDTLL
ncbi:unnamed protein product, partial [Medioppia subpectinata]